jgi:heterodisulfide reductase subunit A-like polyferredoxin
VSLIVNKAFINPAICKGCGRCAAVCRLKAIDARHYDFKQISSVMDPYFLKKVKSEESLDDKEGIIAMN